MSASTKTRTRRRHPRAGVSWTVWIRSGEQRLRHHTVDISPHGAKLRPRGTLQPGTPVELLVSPPDARPVRVSGVIWRVDSDGMAVLFLGGIPAGLAAQGLGAAAADYR
jgi:hypothetical protein